MARRDLLGTKEVAQLTGLSQAHVRRLLIEGDELHGQKINRWTWLVERDEVDRFMRERERARR